MNKSLFSAVLIMILASANVASAQIQMTFTIAHPTCHGYTNGSTTVFAVGGTAPYTYNWNNAQTTQTCSGIGAGTYTVTVTDATLSTASGSISVSEPSAVSTAITSDNVGCNGASGTLTAAGFGGTAPYSYAWDGPNSSSTESVAVTAPGNYFVTVTDANGCEGVGSFTVPPPLSVEVVATDIPCSIYPNGGALNAIVTGGLTPYTFSWSNGATSQLVTGVGAGTYICTVTGANGCIAIASDQVDIPTPLEAALIWLSPACGGNNNGAATVQASGGTPPYTYTWTPGPLSGPSQTGLAPGQYYVCVFDSNLCQKDIWVIIPATTGLDVQLVVTSATCLGINNATATAVVSPPGSGYVYEWTTLTPDSVVTPITGVIQLTELAVGTIVSVTVTDPISGCSGTATGIVGAHTTIDLAVTDVDILCEGGFGSATALASNGTPPYTYTWYHNNLLFGDSSSIFGLNAGAYLVSVVDALGCEANSVADIGIKSAPNAIIDGGHVLVCGDSLSTVQFINASTDPYNSITSLVWMVNGPNIDTMIVQQSQITFQLPVDDTITVKLIATSGLGCSDTAILVYNIPGYPDFSLSIDSTTLNCSGDSVSIHVIGGDTSYTYVWNPAVTYNPDPLNVLVNPIVTTTYVLTATDGNACTATDSITIAPFGLFELYVSETLIRTCEDSVTLTATTNIPATIIWVLEDDIAFSGNSITVPATSITSIYTVTAISADSCILKEEVSVTGYGIELSLDSNAVLTICEGESLPLSVIVTPMSDSLTFLWTVSAPGLLSDTTAANPTLTGPVGNYTVTVIVTNVICSDTLSFQVEILPGLDLSGQFLADLCDRLHVSFFNNNGIAGTWDFGDGSPLSIEPNPVHDYDSAGVYHVIFTPTINLQCLITWDSLITVFADTLIAGIAHNYVDCINQAEIQFLGSANRPDSLIVAWAWTFSSGTPTSSTLQNPVVTIAQEDTITANLIAQDINGCLDSTSVQLTATIVHDTIPNAAQICPGDSVQLNPGGFDLGANYFWTSVPFDSTLVPNIPNPTVNPLVATTYSVEITKGLCTVNYTVEVSLKPGAEVDLPNDMVACSTDSLSITAQSNGATGYEWSIFPNFSDIFATTQTVLVLPPGTFYVRTTGADCFDVDSVHVSLGTLDLQISAEADIVCPGGFGSASAVASIGTPPYIYSWFNSDSILIGNDQSITGLDTGAYSVIVIDSVGCTAEAAVNIALLSAPNAVIDGGHVLVCGDSISTVQFINLSSDPYDQISSFVWTITGPTVSYVISNQDSITLQLPVDETITVQLIATSSLDCSDTTTLEYNVPGYPDLTLSLDSSTINCTAGSLGIHVIGGDSTYTYVWTPTVGPNPDLLNVLVNPTATTTYVLIATDGNACTATDSITVEPNIILELFVSDTLVRTCSDSVTISASTNIPAFIIWTLEGDIAFSGNTITVPATSTTSIYTVTAITGDSCILKQDVSITGYNVEIELDSNAVLSICEGDSLPLSVLATPFSDSLSYLWSVNAPAEISDTTASNPTLTGPAGNYTVTVIVTNVICADTLSFQVEILPGFNLEGQILADLCNGLEVSFFNDSLIGGVWDFGDSTNSNAFNPIHTYDLAGQYHVIFTSNLQCTPAWDSTIHVNALPLEASMSFVYLKCADQAEIQFNGFTNLLEFDSVVWAWTFANGTPANSSLSNPIVTYTEEDTVTATLIVQDINGCLDTVSLQVIVLIIKDTIPNAFSICPGDSIQLNPGGFDLGAEYKWTSVPFDSTLNMLDPTPVVTPTVPTTYSVEIKQGLFCSTLYTVDLSFKPGSDVDLAVDTLIVCTGDTLSITAQSNGATGYEWSTSPSFDPVFAVTKTVQVLPNRTYYVRTTGAECFDVDSMRIELEIPEIQIMPSDTNICLGEETTLILMNLNPEHILVNYDWEPDLPNMPNPIVSPTETTTYSVTVTNQFGCTASLVFPTINVTTVSVDAVATPDSLSFTIPTTILKAITGGNGTVISYSWWPTGTLSHPNSAETGASPTETTTYTVTVTTSDGCIAIDSVTVHFRESSCVSPFVFIPNTFTPNHDQKNDLFIVRADGMTALKMIVWDRWGEIVYETNDPNDPGWDGTYKGKEVTPDSFAWYVWLTCGNGDIFESKGNVTLLK